MSVLRRLRCFNGRNLGSILVRIAIVIALGFLLMHLAGPRAADHLQTQHQDGSQSKRENDAKKETEGEVKLNFVSKDLTYPVSLELELPESIRNDPILKDRNRMMRQYGFNLALSNSMPLYRRLDDHRSADCLSIEYPKDMPKVSVIIIFYNEPLSTLLRNVVSVLNRSPQHLLGEIVLVDDNSTLKELDFLPQHLEKLPPKIRLVRRNIHNGIVGARVRGARESKYPIIAFIDR